MTTEFKQGDRVKVTDVLEATVDRVDHEDGTISTTDGDWLVPSDLLSEGWQRTFEKLPDPEPTWVNGDVILVVDGAIKSPMIYNNVTRGEPFWACTSCPKGWHAVLEVSVDWEYGNVEILWKASAT